MKWIDKMKSMGIEHHHVHTSGHATLDELKRFVAAFPSVTGIRNIGCPCCEARYELAVDAGNLSDAYCCDNCGNAFEVDWMNSAVRNRSPLEGPGFSGQLVTITDGDGVRMEIRSRLRHAGS
jgi:hypothetical protein